jgi:ribonuclease HIII
VLPDPTLNLQGRIGIDESGKGDFFGPLCVAGVFAEGDLIMRLKELGVRDSKTLNDNQIIALAAKIRREFPHHIVKINPPKYNELITKFKNLNHLLAWGHATTIEQMVEKTCCKKIIVDQFASEEVVLTAVKRKNLKLEITQRHRAEEDLVVAAASILARCAFVEGLELLEKKFHMKLPKGASKQTIAAGKAFIREHGQEMIGEVGKVHFKTMGAIIG